MLIAGRRVCPYEILSSLGAPGQDNRLAVLDLETGQRTALIRGASHAEYVETGHLVYVASGTLRTVRFDPARLEVLSDPVPVVESVRTTGGGAADFAISRGGTLVFVPRQTGTPRSLVWVDRQGREEAIKAPARAYLSARLSPDGTRVALDIGDQENDIWVWDLARQTLTRLTSDPGIDQRPVWTPDGRRILFSSTRGGQSNLHWQAADGSTTTVERLTTSTNPQVPSSISADGTRVVFTEVGKAPLDINLLILDGPSAGPRSNSGVLPSPQGSGEPGRSLGEVRPLIQTTFSETDGEISPDSRWLAYASNESGQYQVYVRPFPTVDEGRWQVSTGGGTSPAWARGGRDLFHLDVDGALTVVPVKAAGIMFSAGNPSKVFDTRYYSIAGLRTYDVSADGRRFLMIKENAATDRASTSTPASLVVVLNWHEELKRLVPTK